MEPSVPQLGSSEVLAVFVGVYETVRLILDETLDFVGFFLNNI